MVALSYPRESCESGACWFEVFQYQRDFIKYTHSVGGDAGAELRMYADVQFREMLDCVEAEGTGPVSVVACVTLED